MSIFSGLFRGGAVGALLGSAIPGLGTALGAGLGALSGGFSGYSAMRHQQRMHSFYRDNWNDQARLSWDQWNAANAYNHPKQQMLRFREAGLNPHLVYGQMSNVSPAAHVHSQASFGSSEGGVTDFLGAMNLYANARNLNSQVALRDTERLIAEREANQRSDDFFDRLSLRPLERRNLALKNELLEAQIDNVLEGDNDLSTWLTNALKGVGILGGLKTILFGTKNKSFLGGKNKK